MKVAWSQFDEKPTEKQLKFIKDICALLCLSEPECKTKEQARKFISDHMVDYQSEFKKRVAKNQQTICNEEDSTFGDGAYGYYDCDIEPLDEGFATFSG